MELTAAQAKMVIEHFAKQAAEDYPDTTLPEQDKHMWLTRYQCSVALKRRITEADWEEVVAAVSAYESFDRDPDGYLHQNGYKVTADEREYMKDNLQVEVSFAIDNCFNNSGA